MGAHHQGKVSTQEMTGQRTLSLEPLKEYFSPLIDWLKEQNKGKKKGWIDGCPSPR